MARLTPAGAGELCYGFVINTGTCTAGSTTGYTYNANADIGQRLRLQRGVHVRRAARGVG